VHGADGMDEITTTGETAVVEQKGGEVKAYTLTPEDFGLERVAPGTLSLPDRDHSVRMAEAFLRGEAPRPHEDLVLLNAGAVIYLGGKAGSLAEGLSVARDTLHSGAARRKAEEVAAYTQSKRVTSDA